MRKTLDEIIERSDPEDWAHNWAGELAGMIHALALEVRELKVEVKIIQDFLAGKPVTEGRGLDPTEEI